MTHTRGVWLLALGLAVALPDVTATDVGQPTRTGPLTPIVKSRIRADTAPNYGCDGWHYTRQGSWWTLTLLPGGSPSGTDALRFTGLPNKEGGQLGWGCRFGASLENSPPQGAVRYARWRIRYNSPMNWRSDSCASPPCRPNARTAPDKLFILGNTCESEPHQPTRIIYTQYAAPPARNKPLNSLSQNIGQAGPRSGGTTGYFDVSSDRWLNVQIRIESSSTTSTSDGRLSVWVNNNNLDKPTSSTPKDILIRTAGWGTNTCPGSHIVWGDGSFNAVSVNDPTARVVIDLADFEYDDEFDPNWSIGQSVP